MIEGEIWRKNRGELVISKNQSRNHYSLQSTATTLLTWKVALSLARSPRATKLARPADAVTRLKWKFADRLSGRCIMRAAPPCIRLISRGKSSLGDTPISQYSLYDTVALFRLALAAHTAALYAPRTRNYWPARPMVYFPTELGAGAGQSFNIRQWKR